MDLLIALIVAVLIGIAAVAVLRWQFINPTLDLIRRHIAALIAIMLFSFYLFANIGLNIWSVTIIPVISLLLAFLIIRSAFKRLLEIH